ncbi:MAG: F0F1 ATP synthase subunit B [Actinomycetota bacterium]|nr:F0F1 ATP synthase subunit B [Actinomycetota bacterium]
MPVLHATIVLATEAGEEVSGLQLVLPEFAELFWGIIGFALLMAIMFRKVFPSLNRMLAERQAGIQGQLEQAEATRTEAETLRRQYADQLADARAQGNAILDEAKTSAERLRADILANAEEEAKQIVARARQDAESERGRLVQDLRGQVAVLSVELAGKIVQRELDPAQHGALVDQYITELSGLN